MALLEKQKIMKLFEEVLENWEIAESYVIQNTYCIGDNYDHESLGEVVSIYKKEFLEALNS